MKMIGCDLHAAQQTLAILDSETGETYETVVRHEDDRVRTFYASLAPPVLVGLEATGSMWWFLELLDDFGIAYRVGHPARIRQADARKQKHDRRDAALLLRLLVEQRFPAIWVPSTEFRDLRALLLHRHQYVRMRTRVMNALQGLALSHGVQRGAALWSRDGQARLTALKLAPHAANRRAALQALYRQLGEQIDDLDQRVRAQAEQRPRARQLMTHPGVGPVTALATEVFLGDPSRFSNGKAVASYVGLIPSEYSSGARQHLGALTKQGNPFLRFLWCEAAIHAVRHDRSLGRFYRHKLHHKGLGKARVAVARKLGIRLWILLRDQIDYSAFCQRSPAAAPAR